MCKRHAVSLVVVVPMLLALDALAAQRTFVSTGGLDSNACILTAPCRSFAKAITLTDPAGEIVVLDSGGYGAVVVDKNVTVTSPAGVYAGLSVFAGSDGIRVSAPATKVVLRGLSINGQGGDNGIRVQAGEVHVENVVIANMGQAGIRVEGGTTVRIAGSVMRSNADGLRVVPGAGSVSVLARDSEFSANATAGIGVSPSAGGSSAQVTVERSSVTKNGAGVVVAPTGMASASLVLMQSVASENAGAGVSSSGAGATVYVRESSITRNGTGLLQASSGVLNACGANLLVANATAQSGAINTASCLDVASGSGTVTSVATGAGLTGGPITTTGTINLAATQLLPTIACGNTQVPKWSGAAWVCAADANSGGTVTSVGTGTGLTGGPITTSGTVGIANGGVGNAQLASASVDVNKLDTASTDARYFRQGGNAFGATAVIGTTDNQPVTVLANGASSLRLIPFSDVNNAQTVHVVNGSPTNGVAPGIVAATIGGGGGTNSSGPWPNQVTGSYGTVAGGMSNTSGDTAAVGGGFGNAATGYASTIGGGSVNTTGSGNVATVGGGNYNNATGTASTVAGGFENAASAFGAAVGGGEDNAASANRATAAGGAHNRASGQYAMVPGGIYNVASGDYSFAAGRQAKTQHTALVGIPPVPTVVPDDGAFVFADSAAFDFHSSGPNQFAARATGGVRFVLGIDGTGNPTWSCSATSGNAWSCSSDRDLKQDLVALDGREVLERLARMPIYQWQPKGANARVRHYGPMAQDFYATFGLGDDDRMIGMQDADGVALAAIQGLRTMVADERDELARKDAEIAQLRVALSALAAKVDALAAR